METNAVLHSRTLVGHPAHIPHRLLTSSPAIKHLFVSICYAVGSDFIRFYWPSTETNEIVQHGSCVCLFIAVHRTGPLAAAAATAAGGGCVAGSAISGGGRCCCQFPQCPRANYGRKGSISIY